MQHARKRDPGQSPWELVLTIVVLLYLVLGVLYATATPPWQVPDEPAHYNYVRYVAENLQLPELRPGDFPADYLEEIKGMRFPPFLSIDPIRYESHQPPLYYVLAAGVYQLSVVLLGAPSPIVLRLFSVLIGGVTLCVGYRVVRRIYPHEPLLALGTMAFAAFLPMHLAINAGVNNDTLSELVLALVVWRLVVLGVVQRAAPCGAARWTVQRSVGLGVLLGVALLTKMQAYLAFGVALFALAWDVVVARRSGERFPWLVAAGRAGIMVGTALLVAAPWLVRNMIVYGPGDPLAMARHDQVVVGQLTTQQFLERYGLDRLAREFTLTTFRSFWGQFGWMGVLLHDRIYVLLQVLTGLVTAGFVVHLLSLRGQGAALPAQTRRGLALLLAWATGTVLVYLWYNTKYVQHQGRYLFPALVPWGLFFTQGLRNLLGRPPRPLLIACGLALGALIVYWIVKGELKGYYAALTVATAAASAAGHWLETRHPGAALGLAYFCLASLAVICLYGYVVPILRPFV